MNYSIATVTKKNVLESELLSDESVKEFTADQKQTMARKYAMRTVVQHTNSWRTWRN